MENNILIHLKEAGMLLLEIILYIVLSLGLGFVFIFMSEAITGYGLDFTSSSDIDPWKGLVSEYLPLLIGAMLSLYLIHTLFFNRSWHLTGFVPAGVTSQFGIGALIASTMLGIGFLALWLFQLLRIDNIDWNPISLLGFFIFFLIQSTYEEVVTRAYLIPTIERRYGVWPALILSSLLFTLLHGSNPNVNWVGLLNIFLAGMILGMLFIRFRTIWAPIGMHSFWNFLQGSVLGFEVSGMGVYSLIDTTEVGNDLITGGAFGFEGSILSVVFLLIGCGLVYIEKSTAFTTLSIYSQEEANETIHV